MGAPDVPGYVETQEVRDGPKETAVSDRREDAEGADSKLDGACGRESARAPVHVPVPVPRAPAPRLPPILCRQAVIGERRRGRDRACLPTAAAGMAPYFIGREHTMADDEVLSNQ